METEKLGNAATLDVEPSLGLVCCLLESHTDLALIGEDLDGRIVLWTEGARTVYGFAAAEVLGRSSAQVFRPPGGSDSEHPYEPRRAALRDNKWEGRLWRARKNSDRFPVDVTLSPRRDESGRAIGFVELSRDVSAVMRAAGELEAADGVIRSGRAVRAAHPGSSNFGRGETEARQEETKRLLQVLSRRLLETQETERRHIARELHDEIGQNLTFLKIGLRRALLETARSGGLPGPLEDGIAVIEETLRQVRDLSLRLRPPLLDTAGLVPALRWFLDRQAQRAGLAISFTADPPDARLSADLEIVCFRVVQEAVTNVVRHARARRVMVGLRVTDRVVRLTIRDDGAGFDVDAARRRASLGVSLGLVGMEERVRLAGGELDLSSNPSRGTTIEVRFPMGPSSAREEAG